MSGPFSSVVNFSVADFLRRGERLSILQSIKSEAESNSKFSFLFPRHHKQSKLKRSSTSTQLISTSLTVDEIERTVQRAFEDAWELLTPLDLGILNNNQNLMTINGVSAFVRSHLEKNSMINDPSQRNERSTSSSESDSDSSTDLTEPIGTISDSDNDQEDQEESDCECLSNVGDGEFRGMRLFDSVKPSVVQSYFKIAINGKTKFLHKQTACWLLTQEKSSLSSDRLTRVRTKQ